MSGGERPKSVEAEDGFRGLAKASFGLSRFLVRETACERERVHCECTDDCKCTFCRHIYSLVSLPSFSQRGIVVGHLCLLPLQHYGITFTAVVIKLSLPTQAFHPFGVDK